MSEAEGVSLLVALAALGLSAASYWNSAGKPAELKMDPLPTGGEVSKGGLNDRPHISQLTLIVAVANEGARAGLLTSVEVAKVRATGAEEFAEGISAPRYEAGSAARITTVDDGQLALFPRTLEGGAVRSLGLCFEIRGPFNTLLNTLYQTAPNQSPYAEMLARLERLDVEIACEYRTQGGILRTTRHTKSERITVSIDGEQFRQNAGEFWRGQNMNSLASRVGF